MLEHLHRHIIGELEQSAKTDTVFVVTAVLFNLLVLGINWGVASARQPTTAGNVILVVLVVVTLLINSFVVLALQNGRRTRLTLIGGVIQMYKDNGVDKYYDPALLGTYGTRYNLFTAVIICLAGIAVFVPLIQKFIG
jgi:hypothetical protein